MIHDPWKSMKPLEDWPERLRTARSLINTMEDLELIASGLYQPSMTRIVEPSEIIYDRFGNALSGAFFGVGKDQFLEDDPLLQILSLISNLVPRNEVQQKIHGDNASLPYCGQWRSLLARKGDASYLCSEDMKACSFLFQLPKETFFHAP